MGGSGDGSSQQIRMTSKCGPMHPFGYGLNQGQVIMWLLWFGGSKGINALLVLEGKLDGKKDMDRWRYKADAKEKNDEVKRLRRTRTQKMPHEWTDGWTATICTSIQQAPYSGEQMAVNSGSDDNTWLYQLNRVSYCHDTWHMLKKLVPESCTDACDQNCAVCLFACVCNLHRVAR